MMTKMEPGKTRVGWIGTGVMGASMCGHLMASGLRGHGLQRARAPRRSRC